MPAFPPTPRLGSRALALLAAALILLGAPAASASLPLFVSKRGVAVCWEATDSTYAKELTRAQNIWNGIAGRSRILNASQGCVPNFEVVVDTLTAGRSIQGTTYDGDTGYKGEIILYKRALAKWPECRRWIALHEFGHALGLHHDKKYKTIMHAECPASFSKPVNRPTKRDVRQFWSIWGSGPRGYVSDVELASELGSE
jgi:hypothetical protein